MYILPDRTLGILIMAFFALMGVFMLLTPGSLRLQRPNGGFAVWAYNILNLTTVLVFLPAAALCLMKGWEAPLRWTEFSLPPPAVSKALGVIGLTCFSLGNLLICWSRAALGRSFRLGAVPPEGSDELVTRGPFAFVRHPMYSAVLLLSLGLGLMLRSYLFLGCCAALVAAFIQLIPVEEAQLRESYGEAYDDYSRKTRRLVPFVF